MAKSSSVSILSLCSMWIVCRLAIHIRFISHYLTRYRTYISAYHFCYFSITFTFFVKFLYTTAFFYGKMFIVHTISPLAFCSVKLIIPKIRMNCFLFLGVALESIIHLSNKKSKHACFFVIGYFLPLLPLAFLEA